MKLKITKKNLTRGQIVYWTIIALTAILCTILYIRSKPNTVSARTITVTTKTEKTKKINSAKPPVDKTEVYTREESVNSASNDVVKKIAINFLNDKKYEPVPAGDTNWFLYMDADTITDKSTKQYWMKCSYKKDIQGLWRYGNDYVVAMGSGYGQVGSRFKVMLETGAVYTVIMGDVKADSDTDAEYHLSSKSSSGKLNVIEFIVDESSLDPEVRASGNIGTYSNLCGKIATIEKLS